MQSFGNSKNVLVYSYIQLLDIALDLDCDYIPKDLFL